MHTIRYGIAGVSTAAQLHADAIFHTAGAELVAVCPISGHAERVDTAAFGVPCLADVASLVALPDLDAVCICSPNHLHASHAVAVAEAGKHMLIEPPIALTLADADAVIASCQCAGVALGMAIPRRTEPQFLAIHTAIAEGDLGQLLYSNALLPYARLPQAPGEPAPLTGGLLFNQGLHLIDLMIWFMGDIANAQAHAASLAYPGEAEIENIFTASLQFVTGALGSIGMTNAAGASFPQRLGIYGSNAGVQIEGEHVIRAKGDLLPARLSDLPNSDESEQLRENPPFGLNATAHMRLITDFSAAVRDGRTPLASGAEGRRTLAAVLQLYAATSEYGSSSLAERAR